jgi:TPR repeat protein
VRQGNIEAEVALAKLYLEGTEVPQNCEQAHMLLLAASKKGNNNADELLSGSYAERCP